MANHSSISRFLGAALLSVSATFLLAAPAHASVNADVREAGEAISKSDTRVHDVFIRVSANSARQLRNRSRRQMLVPQQQATGTQNASGSLSNGASQQPLLAPAGDEMKKIIKNLPKPNCGGPQDVC